MMDLPELIVLDVGHGNCAILRDTNAVTVIDCPPALTLLETLERLGISTIDQVLISHADVDHVGGLINLLEDVIVRNIYINPDADKKSRIWKDIRIALGLAEERGTEVHVGLTSQWTKKFNSGQIEIEILAPSTEIALSGAGGDDSEDHKLTSNSMSVVVGLMHNSQRVAILPGDIDDRGLDNLLVKQRDIEAQILIFPHHGGLPGGKINGHDFARKLCALVKPHLIVFSIDRDRFKNPREDTMQGVLSVVPNAHIVCTQLSRKCAAELPDSNFDHLTSLPAMGRARGKCCGGTISIKINGKQSTYAPLFTLHRNFVSNKSNVTEPMCLRYHSSVKP
ncbi:MAG TPA: MBL fold metallo-hydrolase [Methylomirabilota bacterium]|nr:MBL fold metallo-hydrolase [Methylomirabilota bacterium]